MDNVARSQANPNSVRLSFSREKRDDAKKILHVPTMKVVVRVVAVLFSRDEGFMALNRRSHSVVWRVANLAMGYMRPFRGEITFLNCAWMQTFRVEKRVRPSLNLKRQLMVLVISHSRFSTTSQVSNILFFVKTCES